MYYFLWNFWMLLIAAATPTAALVLATRSRTPALCRDAKMDPAAASQNCLAPSFYSSSFKSSCREHRWGCSNCSNSSCFNTNYSHGTCNKFNNPCNIANLFLPDSCFSTSFKSSCSNYSNTNCSLALVLAARPRTPTLYRDAKICCDIATAPTPVAVTIATFFIISNIFFN